MTSCSGPATARQVRMRRSSVRRILGFRPGWRRRISSKTAIARMPGAGFQDRDDLGVPNLRERIGPAPPAWRLFLGRQTRIVLDPVAGCFAEASLGGGNSGAVGLSETHIQPHLMVGNVEAGQALIPRRVRRISSLTPSCSTARRLENVPPWIN